MASPHRNARRISRRIPRHITVAVRQHNRQVGDILWAWNLVQDQLFGLFSYFFADKRHLSSAIWHTIQSDKVQREMLSAIARADLPANSKTFANIKWLLDRIGDLSPLRNDPAHTPIYVARLSVGSALIPSAISGRPAAVDRLTARPTKQIWRAARADLFVLAVYAREISIRLENPTRQALLGPLPRRPALLSLVAKHHTGPRKSRPQSSKANRRPPSTSKT